MKTRLAKLLSLSLLAATAVPVVAIEDSSSVSVGVAGWAVFDQFDQFGAHLDYQHSPLETWWGLQPRAVIILVEQNQQYYGIGAAKAFDISTNWSWGIASHVGYVHNVDTLGYDLEFYSFLFAKYRISRHHALRGEIGHISNAGFGDKNPGSETLVFSYTYHF
ncbi:MAG: acyloxyacyl hydrolase [Parahaliea sp.]